MQGIILTIIKTQFCLLKTQFFWHNLYDVHLHIKVRLVWDGGHKLEDEHPVEGAAARAEVRGQPTENKVGTVKEENKYPEAHFAVWSPQKISKESRLVDRVRQLIFIPEVSEVDAFFVVFGD